MDEKEIQSLIIHYFKSNNFHTHHTDGAVGGITPQGDIGVNFYSERHPIPQEVEYEYDKNNATLGKLIKEDKKMGIVREVECGIVMSLNIAKSVHIWLGEKIAELEKLTDGK